MREKPAIPSLVLIPGETKDDYAAIYTIASAYAYSGLLISDQGREIDQPVLAFPAVVCSSFAIELFLKFFIGLERAEGIASSKKNIHSLEDLWNQISLTRRNIVAGMFRNSLNDPVTNALEVRLELFKEALNGISTEKAPFVKWRYAHELENVSLMSHAAIEEISDALHRAATYCMQLKFANADKQAEAHSEQDDSQSKDSDLNVRKDWEAPSDLIRRTSGKLILIQGHEPILLNRESPLRRLPVNLDKKIAVFFDGIRYTVEFLDIAYSRIYETLTQMAFRTSTTEIPNKFAHVFMDAWTFVYAVNRFEELYKNIPGIKFNKRDPNVPTFHEITETFRSLRRTADRLVATSESIVALEGSALGELNWITGIEVRPKISLWHCTMRPGTLHKQPSQSTAPFKSTMGWPTDGIRLSFGQFESNLSAIRPHIAIRIRDLEQQLENAFSAPDQKQIQIINDFFAKRCVTVDDSEQS